MSALAIPTEIWLDIAPYLDHKDYLSLVLVCRDFYHIFTEPLYSDLVIKFPPALNYYAVKWNGFDDTHLARFSPAGPWFTPLLERLDTHPTLRNHVRVVHVKNLVINRVYPVGRGFRARYVKEEDPHKALHDCFVDAVMNLLRSLPRLKSVEFTGIEMETRALIHLASGPGQNLMIHLIDSKLYGVVDPPPTRLLNAQGVLEGSKCPVPSTSVTARALVLDPREEPPGKEALMHFLSASSIKVLNIRVVDYFGHELYSAFTSLGRPQLPHLHTVTIPFIEPNQVDILGAMTNLRELRFMERSYYGFAAPTYDLGGLLRNLEAIDTHYTSIFNFTSGRRIVKIKGWQAYDSTQWVDLMACKPRFGSDVMVRTFEWSGYWKSIEILLDYLIEKNPGVWHLSLPRENGLTPAKEVTERHISKYVKLPELRSVCCPLLTRLPLTVESLIWEEEQCQALRGGGCPSLVSVSFREQATWIRHPDETTWRLTGSSMGLWVQK